MLVVGLQGSPRRKGNTRHLLDLFLEAARRRGALTELVEVDQREIVPCKEYTVCERRGTCPIEDEMPRTIYPLLREADVLVAATPVFFYNMSAQLKALVDRCQVFWARKYRLGLRDPKRAVKRGFLLAVGATRGQNLFDAIDLSLRYFFDALDAGYGGRLTYRGIEGAKDMARHPTVAAEVEAAVGNLLDPLAGRPRALFVDRGGAGTAPMAAALLQAAASEAWEAGWAGLHPEASLDPGMVGHLAARGLDVGLRRPMTLEEALAQGEPGLVVNLGGAALPAALAAMPQVSWELPSPEGAGGWPAVEEAIRKQLGELSPGGQAS
jgi:multimeric flavodoxin WrbA/protein-tyrosine-phosphatase